MFVLYDIPKIFCAAELTLGTHACSHMHASMHTYIGFKVTVLVYNKTIESFILQTAHSKLPGLMISDSEWHFNPSI